MIERRTTIERRTRDGLKTDEGQNCVRQHDKTQPTEKTMSVISKKSAKDVYDAQRKKNSRRPKTGALKGFPKTHFADERED